jgi:hypothetical protein
MPSGSGQIVILIDKSSPYTRGAAQMEQRLKDAKSFDPLAHALTLAESLASGAPDIDCLESWADLPGCGIQVISPGEGFPDLTR